MFHVSRLLMPNGKGKNQAKLQQKSAKILISQMKLLFLSGSP